MLFSKAGRTASAVQPCAIIPSVITVAWHHTVLGEMQQEPWGGFLGRNEETVALLFEFLRTCDEPVGQRSDCIVQWHTSQVFQPCQSAEQSSNGTETTPNSDGCFTVPCSTFEFKKIKPWKSWLGLEVKVEVEKLLKFSSAFLKHLWFQGNSRLFPFGTETPANPEGVEWAKCCGEV